MAEEGTAVIYLAVTREDGEQVSLRVKESYSAVIAQLGPGTMPWLMVHNSEDDEIRIQQRHITPVSASSVESSMPGPPTTIVGAHPRRD
jgi:hypothetical protein